MRKQLLIAAAVVVVAGAVYALWDYNKLTSLGQKVDARWPESESQYKTRLETINGFKEEVRNAMPEDQKLFTELEKDVVDLKMDQPVPGRIKALNNVEKEVAKIIAALEKYPELKNSDSVKGYLEKLMGDSSLDWAKAYNDEAIRYNITIKRIRNRFVTSMFNIKSKETIEPMKNLVKTNIDKAEKKKKKEEK